MKVLLDENVPLDLELLMPAHEVSSVKSMAWKGLKNGALIRQAEDAAFHAMVTADQSIYYQQNNLLRTIALIVLNTNFKPSVMESAKVISAAIDAATPGSFAEVHCGPSRAARKRR